MDKSRKILSRFLKIFEEDSDINGSTGAVLDVALKGGPIDMARAKGLPKSAGNIEWDNANHPEKALDVPSIHHPLESEFAPAKRMNDVKNISPGKMIDTNDFPAGYQDRDMPVEQNMQGGDGTILDPELPTSKQTIIHDPMYENNKTIKPRIQDNDFTQWNKEMQPGANVKGLPFSLNYMLIDKFLSKDSEIHSF